MYEKNENNEFNEKNENQSSNEKNEKNIFDEFNQGLNDFKTSDLEDFAKNPDLGEKKEPLKEENKVEEAPLTIAPPTEIKVEEETNTNTIHKNEFVFEKIKGVEKTVNTLFIISIISIFAGPIGMLCCCVPSLIVNIVVIVLGIIYINEVNKLVKVGSFTDFDNLRVQSLKKKATLILVFGIIGLVVTILISLIPFIIALISGNGYYWSTNPFDSGLYY